MQIFNILKNVGGFDGAFFDLFPGADAGKDSCTVDTKLVGAQNICIQAITNHQGLCRHHFEIFESSFEYGLVWFANYIRCYPEAA